MTMTARREGALLAIILVLSTMPMWFVTTPPLIDLLGHMGRYRIQLGLAASPALQANWGYQWLPIGNLGVDLLMELFGRLLGVERASWLVAALLPPLLIWGIVRLARAWHGRVPPTIVAAFPFALSYPWQYGLINFWLGVGLSFHSAASVIGRPKSVGSPAGLAILSLGLWICHVFGWAIFAILVFAHSVSAVPVKQWPRRLPALLPLGIPAIVMALQRYGSHESAITVGWFAWAHKWSSMLFTLRDQYQLFDIACLAFAAFPIWADLRSREQMSVARPGAIAAAILLAAVLILPYQLFGSAWADARLWPVVFMVAIAAVAPRDDAPRAWTLLLPAALLAMFVSRIVVGAVGFAEYDRAFSSHLAGLETIPRGSRVATFVRFPCDVPWRRPRLEHMDGMAIVRRDAFTNGQWDTTGAELVKPLAARGTRYNADPSELLGLNQCRDDLRPLLTETIGELPRDRFDYVWVLDFAPASLPSYLGLEAVYADDRSIIYRIQKP